MQPRAMWPGNVARQCGQAMWPGNVASNVATAPSGESGRVLHSAWGGGEGPDVNLAKLAVRSADKIVGFGG